MATLQELQAEPWWSREIVTAELTWLGDTIRAAYDLSADAIGTKGNERHLRGGHRSQEWIRNSSYCTSRTYTVQSGLTADQARHIAAWDMTPGDWGTLDNRQKMIKFTRRITSARAAGLLPEIREIFGTLDGSTVYGNADDSHLDHLHLTVDRTKLHDAELMARIVDILIGDDPMPDTEGAVAAQYRELALLTLDPKWANDPHIVPAGRLTSVPVIDLLKRLDTNVQQLLTRTPADLTARLSSILQAASDDPTTTVTMATADRDALVQALVAAIHIPSADDVADKFAGRLAD